MGLRSGPDGYSAILLRPSDAFCFSFFAQFDLSRLAFHLPRTAANKVRLPMIYSSQPSNLRLQFKNGILRAAEELLSTPILIVFDLPIDSRCSSLWEYYTCQLYALTHYLIGVWAPTDAIVLKTERNQQFGSFLPCRFVFALFTTSRKLVSLTQVI